MKPANILAFCTVAVTSYSTCTAPSVRDLAPSVSSVTTDVIIFTISFFSKVQTSDVSSATESEDEPEEKESSPEVPKLPPYLPAIEGCRSVEEFQWLNRIEEGTYGVVYRAKDKRTGETDVHRSPRIPVEASLISFR